MNTREENAVVFTPFWPLCLLALSLAVFLGWQVMTAARQYIGLVRLSEQQIILAGQAVQAESKLQAVMIDLLDLAKDDADAREIVGKYGIKFNPAPTPPGMPLPQPRPPAEEPVAVQSKNVR